MSSSCAVRRCVDTGSDSDGQSTTRSVAGTYSADGVTPACGGPRAATSFSSDTFAQACHRSVRPAPAARGRAGRVRPSAPSPAPARHVRAPSRCGPGHRAARRSAAPTGRPRAPPIPATRPHPTRPHALLAGSRSPVAQHIRGQRPRRRNRLMAEILQHHSGAEEFGRGIGDAGGIGVAGVSSVKTSWVRRAKSIASYCSATSVRWTRSVMSASRTSRLRTTRVRPSDAANSPIRGGTTCQSRWNSAITPSTPVDARRGEVRPRVGAQRVAGGEDDLAALQQVGHVRYVADVDPAHLAATPASLSTVGSPMPPRAGRSRRRKPSSALYGKSSLRVLPGIAAFSCLPEARYLRNPQLTAFPGGRHMSRHPRHDLALVRRQALRGRLRQHRHGHQPGHR